MFKRFIEIKIKNFALFLSVLAVVFAFHSPSLAQTTNNESLKNRQILLQEKLNSIKKQINNYQSQISQTKQQQNSLKNQISMYDNQILSIELQMQANDTQREDTTIQIQEIQEQIKRREAEIADSKRILGQLIVQLNELDSNSWLYIGLSSDNFSKFLDQVQYTESVQGKVYSVVQNIKAIKQKLEIQEKELSDKLDELEMLKEQLEISEQAINTERSRKETLLSQTKGLESNFQKLLGQTKNEEANLLQEINDLDDAIRGKLGNRTLVAKGALAIPMKGAVTQGYGNTGFTSLGYNFHNGIDIAAPPGTPIYAAADGTVSSCDTGEAAYGNWCTIKHNIKVNQKDRCIVTLYAHMRSFKVRAGQSVKQGDLIGFEGNTGNTTRLLYGPERGYHLHHTVFDCEGYGVAAGKYSSTYGPYSVPYGYTYNPRNFWGQ